LLALGGQSVEQQREIELARPRPHPLRIGLQRRQLVVEQRLRFVEQTPDERALAIVDAAAGVEPQQRLGDPQPDVLVGDRGDARHQKYPSCFFCSIEAGESWSIMRPSRSEVRATNISSMISASVS